MPALTAAPWWSPPTIDSALEALSPHETRVLRLVDLDPLLVRAVLGEPWPADRLATPWQRMYALRAHVPEHAVLVGRGALWVHLGGCEPQEITVCTTRRLGRSTRTRVRRSSLPRCDALMLAGRWVATLERTLADVARTSTPAQAVALLLRARRIGVSRAGLLLALSHCQGAAATGRLRASRLVTAVYNLPS